jgi:hypothetical protein
VKPDRREVLGLVVGHELTMDALVAVGVVVRGNAAVARGSVCHRAVESFGSTAAPSEAVALGGAAGKSPRVRRRVAHSADPDSDNNPCQDTPSPPERDFPRRLPAPSEHQRPNTDLTRIVLVARPVTGWTAYDRSK